MPISEGTRPVIEAKGKENPSEVSLTGFLNDARARDVSLSGGKGKGLAELDRIPGIKVPNAFIIFTSLYDRLIEKNPQLAEKIRILDRASEEWIKAELTDNRGEVELLKREIADGGGFLREELGKVTLLPEMRAEITNAYNMLGENDVAVRSSGTLEDAGDNSSAGQYKTFLHQHSIEQVLESVRECLASQFTERVITYRNEDRLKKSKKALEHKPKVEEAIRMSKDLSHEKSKLAVVVQEMINASSSGVGFSIDPITGVKLIRVEENYGIGEAVVSGDVTPDLHFVDPKTEEIVGRRLGEKGDKTVYCEGGTTTTKVLEEERKRYVSSDLRVKEIARGIKAISEAFGIPVDTEFAVDKEGVLYFLQSRAVTALSNDSMTVEMREKIVPETVAETAEIILKGGITGCRGVASGIKMFAKDVEEAKRLLRTEKYRNKSVILVTEKTNPDWVSVMREVKGIITEKGGGNCHAAIVSREMRCPCLVGTEEQMKLLMGDAIEEITLDASNQTVYRGELPLQELGENVDPRELLENPTETTIGMNVSMPDEAKKLAALAELGDKFKISLFRIEFLLDQIGVHVNALVDFDKGGIAPESNLYKEIADKIGESGCSSGKEYFITILSEGIASVAALFPNSAIVVRTTDFKTDEYRNLIGGKEYEKVEANPMMGWRGLIRSLSPQNRDGFKWELEAIKRARDMGYKNIEMMFPVVRNPKELTGGPEVDAIGFRGAYEIMKEVGIGRGIDGLKTLIMVEVPANVVSINDFIDAGVNGISFGTNDLTQFTLAVDRGSGVLAGIPWYSETNPAVVEQVRSVIRVCRKRGIETGICGNAPSNSPEFVKMLVKEKINSIGVLPDSFLATYRLVRAEEEKRRLKKRIRETVLYQASPQNGGDGGREPHGN